MRCRRCGSQDIEEHESPIDCMTWRKCLECGYFRPVDPDEEDPVRARIVHGLTQTVASKFKRWGMK